MTNEATTIKAAGSDVKTRVEVLLKRMTLAEKIGQMTQADKRSVQPADVATWFLGSLLSGGGSNPEPNSPQNWAAMKGRPYTY